MESLGCSAFLLSAFPHPTLHRLEPPWVLKAPCRHPEGREPSQLYKDPAVLGGCRLLLRLPEYTPMALMELEATWGCFLWGVGKLVQTMGKGKIVLPRRG